jgi:hypothetical protein
MSGDVLFEAEDMPELATMGGVLADRIVLGRDGPSITVARLNGKLAQPSGLELHNAGNFIC